MNHGFVLLEVMDEEEPDFALYVGHRWGLQAFHDMDGVPFTKAQLKTRGGKLTLIFQPLPIEQVYAGEWYFLDDYNTNYWLAWCIGSKSDRPGTHFFARITPDELLSKLNNKEYMFSWDVVVYSSSSEKIVHASGFLPYTDDKAKLKEIREKFSALMGYEISA